MTVSRHFIVPNLPDVFFVFDSFSFTRRMFMFGMFAFLMIPAGISMIKGRESVHEHNGKIAYNYGLIVVEGVVVGVITGLVGAGGGFLIIPALVLLANVEMKTAIGTSLVIIAIKSLSGFLLGDALTMTIDWLFLVVFTLFSIFGIILGSFLASFFDGKLLKKGFGIFTFVMAIFIFVIEFVVKKK